MSLFKPKGSPHWYYDFQFKGLRYYGSTGVSGRKDAEVIERAERTKVARAHAFGEPKQRPRMTMAEATGRYYEEVSKHRKAPASDFNRLSVISELLGDRLPFHDLDDDKIAVMVATLRGRKVSRKRMIKPATVNRYIECLRRVWRRAAKIWKIQIGDEPEWRQHLLEEPNERVRDLTLEEETRLFRHLRPDYHPMVRFALLSGLRLANVRLLTWRQVNYETGLVTVRLKSKKPEGRVHTVPLTAPMIALLAEQMGHHPIYVFTYQCKRPRTVKLENGHTLARRKGERHPFSHNGWRKAWKDALKAAGIEDFRFHDCRHTAATRTLRSGGGNLKVVQAMLGHTDITTTARYAHALVEDVRKAMEAAQSQDSPKAATAEDTIDQKDQSNKAG